MKKLFVLAGLAALVAVVASALRSRVVEHGIDVSEPSSTPAADEADLGAIDEPAPGLAQEAAQVPMPVEKADPAPPKK